MKRIYSQLFFWGLFLIGSNSMNAQTKTSKDQEVRAKIVEEEEGPIIFKFEPNYLTSKEKRREEMAKIRAVIDSLDIS